MSGHWDAELMREQRDEARDEARAEVVRLRAERAAYLIAWGGMAQQLNDAEAAVIRARELCEDNDRVPGVNYVRVAAVRAALEGKPAVTDRDMELYWALKEARQEIVRLCAELVEVHNDRANEIAKGEAAAAAIARVRELCAVADSLKVDLCTGQVLAALEVGQT